MQRFALLYILLIVSMVTAWTVSGIDVTKVPLNNRKPDSPWCFASSNSMALPPHVNFLATQVWPSARVASLAIQKYGTTTAACNSICEIGCGPGLPSLTAAKMGLPTVMATDIDDFALQLVKEAAQHQNLTIQTRHFDLLQTETMLPKADLYILSDVFESNKVAIGAAWHIHKVLLDNSNYNPQVWVFCQSDRSQRNAFLDELRKLGHDDVSWSSCNQPPPPNTATTNNLWLCEVDETAVIYG